MNKELSELIDKITLQPIGDRLLVYQDSPEQMTKAGLIIPDTAKEKPQTGWIVACGTGKPIDHILLNSLRKISEALNIKEEPEQAITFKVGDHIMFGRYAGVEIEHHDIKLLLMREADVACLLDD